MNITEKTHLCISIITTGKCNCNCEYCHFFANHDRKEYNIDINDKLFDRYLDYINYLLSITSHITCRFSGGEPLFMGNKVFKLADKVYQSTGLKPYILTNGVLINEQNILRAKEHNISSFVISVENPFNKIKGTIDTKITIEKFKKFQNNDVPLFFGMMVLANSQFKNIKKIADYFWNEINIIPPMCETNFLPYQRPTEEEFQDLYRNVYEVVKEYNGKSNISLFPYVIPEFYPNNIPIQEYLIEFPLTDIMGILSISNEEALKVTEKRIDKSYFSYDCGKADCEWKASCEELKWVWGMSTDQISKVQKLEDYCHFKQILSQAFYDALAGQNVL